VTAPSVDAGQSPPPVASGPTFSPALFESKPMSGLTSSPVFGSSGPPPADTTGFEPARAFVAPTPVPSASEADEAVTAEGVYEIGAEEASSYESALQEVQQPDPAPRPTPFAQEPAPADPTPSMIARHPEELLGG